MHPRLFPSASLTSREQQGATTPDNLGSVPGIRTVEREPVSTQSEPPDLCYGMFVPPPHTNNCVIKKKKKLETIILVQFSGLPSLRVRWKALRNSHLAHATSGCYLEGYLPGPAPFCEPATGNPGTAPRKQTAFSGSWLTISFQSRDAN